MTELAGLGATMAWQHTNVAAGNLMATYDGQGLHFNFTDWLGTKRAQVNANGTVEQTCLSLPFGDALTCSGPGIDATEHHFTGKERDPESGLDYFGARYFASNSGRWMSPDWAAKAEPIPYAKMGNPQSLNLYAYVENNPLSMADADGHCGAASPISCGGPADQIADSEAGQDQARAANAAANEEEAKRKAQEEAKPAQQQDSTATLRAGVKAAISNNKDAIAAYKKFGKHATSVEQLEADVNSYLTKKWGGVETVGTTSSSGQVDVKPDPNPYTQHATEIHEGVHRATTLEGIAKYGDQTPAYNQWRMNPQRWAADEVKAYSAEIPYLKQVYRDLGKP